MHVAMTVLLHAQGRHDARVEGFRRIFQAAWARWTRLFEILTLLHTGKTDPAPVVLVDEPGGTFWAQWLAFMRGAVIANGYMDEARHVPRSRLSDTVQGAIEEVERFYSELSLVLGERRARSDEATTEPGRDPAGRPVRRSTRTSPVTRGFRPSTTVRSRSASTGATT